MQLGPVVVGGGIVGEEDEAGEDVVGARVLGLGAGGEVNRRRLRRGGVEDRHRREVFARREDLVVELGSVEIGETGLHREEVADGDGAGARAEEPGERGAVHGGEQCIDVVCDFVVERERAGVGEPQHRRRRQRLRATAEEEFIMRVGRTVGAAVREERALDDAGCEREGFVGGLPT